MPEAVTSQHETLWIGATRSSMRRVPHLVSSPEIAPPAQMIDATNLASDRMVYIRGLKDYSGELVWEANSQYYRAGELRDLLALDGCDVYVERRMPMVGVRVSLRGRASVSMSAASPDSIQRVTVRIVPSSAMEVEEWSESTSEGYMVRIRTDSATHMDVVRVDTSYGGRALSLANANWLRQQGAASIPSEFAFSGGYGPFGCFYAAFNIDAYVASTESEEPICTEAGRLAYRLDPYNLKRTIGGTTLVGTYNVLLVIPTVYWTVASNDLYLSDHARYNTISGMTAYAHTADGTIYPYIGIGVYEASDDGTRLVSVPGQAPAANRTHDEFKALADALTPATGCGFQQWNLYQWTLYKMMAYAVMGTKNSQWMLGNGPTSNSSASTTGLADSAGPYADSTSDYDKMLIENSWGSVAGFVGDAFLSDGALMAGQSLGGADLGAQPSTGASLAQTSGSWKWASSLDPTSAGWDVPTAGGDTDTSSDPATSGDRFVTNTGERCIIAGGRWSDGAGAGLGSLLGGNATTNRASNIGARLSYFINEYALGGDAE